MLQNATQTKVHNGSYSEDTPSNSESQEKFSVSDRDYLDTVDKYGEDSKEVENLVYD